MDVEAKIREIIVQQLSVKPERVTLTTRLVDDLGADSLDTVELVMAFEEEFRIEIPDDKAEKMRTVGNVVTFIKEAIAGKSK
ncbi:MAG TPA: acyl carrier protein [Candidatus Methylacidiphilales bacterium]|nr:acyl carrier protein [Candidatus Methylacidiphilales bacterium]